MFNPENFNNIQSEAQEIFDKITDSPQGQKLVRKHAITGLIIQSINNLKDDELSADIFLRSPNLQKEINNIIIEVMGDELMDRELSISHYVEIYFQFSRFIKFIMTKLSEEGAIKTAKIPIQEGTDINKTLPGVIASLVDDMLDSQDESNEEKD